MGAWIPDIRLIGKHKCSKCGDEDGPHFNVRPTRFRRQRVECLCCHIQRIEASMARRTDMIVIAFCSFVAAVLIGVFLWK